MLLEIGKFFGTVTLILFIVAVFNYVMKYVNKSYGQKIKKANPNVHSLFMKLMKYVVKYHKIVGIGAFVALIIHFIILTKYFGFVLTGTVAAVLMVIQIALGIYGALSSKKRDALWFKIHRIVTVIVIVAVIIHVGL